MTATPDALTESIWSAIVAQEGAEPDPGQSVGRQATRARGLDAGPAPAAELPLLTLTGPSGDLEVRGLIGRGGMGQVEVALQRSLRREVALKRPREEAGADGARALVREALHMGALEHPNIVPVYQLGRDEEGHPALLMQRVSGVEWLDLIEDPEHPRWTELPADRLQFHIDVLRQVCNAVHYAHSRGILHRDIKPANVMLGRFGEVYLLDWGLSVGCAEPRDAGAPIVGTPAYFAPEMVDLTRPLSTRTDVYLLGATLHHVLTGRPRHTSGPDGARSVIYSAFRSEPFAYDPAVPAELAELCNQATHRDPERRPGSAAALRRRLEDFLQHRGSVRTCEQARGALAALRALAPRAGAERERLIACFAECRLGFEQALDSWPGNDAAREGLQECLELRIAHELEQRNKGTVEELLVCLPRPRPDLEARLEDLRARLELEAESSARLRFMEEDLDVTAAGRSRAALFLLLGGLSAGGMLVVAALVALGATELTFDLRLTYQLALPVVFAAGVAATRRALLRTTGARRIAACTGLIVASPGVASLVNGGIEAANNHALASVLQTVILVVMAIAFDRRIGQIALVTGSIALGCIAWPERFLWIQGVGTLLAFAVAARVTQPGRDGARGWRPESS